MPSAAHPRIADTATTTGLAVGATAARDGVAVTLTDARTSVWERGLEVQLMLTNTSGQDLHFFFTPERDLHMEDDRGAHLNLRWAEYEGEVTVPRGQKRQLVRALYDGELTVPNVTNLTLTLRDAPALGEASWTIPVPRAPDGAQP